MRKGKILRNFEIFLPKFHFILPNFYFPVPWRIFVSSLEIRNFLGRNWGSPLVALTQRIELAHRSEEVIDGTIKEIEQYLGGNR